MKKLLALAALAAGFLAAPAQAQQNMTICDGQVEIIARVTSGQRANQVTTYGVQLRNLTQQRLLVILIPGEYPQGKQLVSRFRSATLEPGGQYQGELAVSLQQNAPELTVPELVRYLSNPATRCMAPGQPR